MVKLEVHNSQEGVNYLEYLKHLYTCIVGNVGTRFIEEEEVRYLWFC